MTRPLSANDSPRPSCKNIYLNFINKLHAMDYLLHDLLGLYQKILKEEIVLLTVLKKEYHLE